MNRNVIIIIRLVVLELGSIISAYGITLAIGAGFGGATLAVLWQGVGATLKINIGYASLLIALAMIIFVFVYDKKQIHIGTVLYQITYSYCVGIFSEVHVYSSSHILNFIIMIVGLLVFAVGTGIYASTNLGSGSYEALMLAISEKHGFEIKTVRMVLDSAIVILGAFLGGKVGLCTICTVIISGPVIHWIIFKMKKSLSFLS